MTPAINFLKKKKIDFTIHEYEHDDSSESYGEEAALKMGIPTSQVFKTLLVKIDNKELIVAVLPVAKQLNLKLLAKSARAKKAVMADKDEAQRTTGYVLGGISPLGQKKKLKTLIDNSSLTFNTIYISAGRRGLEVELTPNDLQKSLNASLDNIY